MFPISFEDFRAKFKTIFLSREMGLMSRGTSQELRLFDPRSDGPRLTGTYMNFETDNINHVYNQGKFFRLQATDSRLFSQLSTSLF